jgi:L-serine dehydratase
MVFESIADMLAFAQSEDKPLWRLILAADAEEQGISEETSLQKMRTLLAAMHEADASYNAEDRSGSGLSGGSAARMTAAQANCQTITGEFITGIIAGALRMAEANACMKRIVAAPTAGSCGVLPALLFNYAERFKLTDEDLLPALYIAGGFGQVIAGRVSISGAEGGCQAEVGTASAMGAAALVQLHGGSPHMMAQACAMAIKNLMGLVCDPVAGLVEVPCVKRNVIGAMNALASAEMALAGIESAIPPDEVLDAMREVGLSLPVSLRETGEGGLAATSTGKAIRQKIRGQGSGVRG